MKPPSLPIVGSMLHYLRNPLGFLEETATMGDVVPVQFATRKLWLINEPHLVDQILVKQASSMMKDTFVRELKNLLGEGLLTSDGDFWKRQRRLIQPAFHRDRIASYGRIMVDHTVKMLASWPKRSEAIDLHHAMMSLTADIVTHALFGAQADDNGEVAWCIETVMARFADPLYLMVPGFSKLPLPANLKMQRAAQRLDAIVHGFIRRRRNAKAAGDGGEQHDDLLGMLLDAQDEDGATMTDKQVRDEVLILFLAGHETTALNLSWTFHLLAQHPDVERKLHAELATVLGGRSPELADIPKLAYCERIIQESMRLYPPAWSLGRDTRGAFDLAGHHFEKGSWLVMNPWTLHRDPRWFPDPLRFSPERWENGFIKTLPKCAYLPFGAGPRICIGNQFAMMEAVLLLATIAQKYELDAVPGQRVVPEPSITLRFKHGLHMRATPRAAS